MEKLLRKAADMQAIRPDDELTDVVHEYMEDELDIEQMDMVYAAVKLDYTEFLKKVMK